MTLLLFNKPFGVLCQFSADGSGKPTLKDYIEVPAVYPAGRLDTTSEGLLALTDDGRLQARLAAPAHKLAKTYWVQVEGAVTEPSLVRLREGVLLKDGLTLPAEAEMLNAPQLWPRDPPIRVRTNSPTSWLALTLREGKNRQVRRMTAAVGFPTLRLIRVAIGPFTLSGLAPGQWQKADSSVVGALLLPASQSPAGRRPGGAAQNRSGRVGTRGTGRKR